MSLSLLCCCGGVGEVGLLVVAAVLFIVARLRRR